MGETTRTDAEFAYWLFWIEYGRSGRAGRGGGVAAGCRGGGFTRWPSRFGRRSVAQSASADLTYRRWKRRYCDRIKRAGARSDALRSEAGDRCRRDASLRRTGRAGAGRKTGERLVFASRRRERWPALI